MSEVDFFLPCERNLKGAIKLQAKILFCWVWIVLREKAALSVKDLDMNVKRARFFVQIKEIARERTKYKVPEGYAEDSLEFQLTIREDFAFELRV